MLQQLHHRTLRPEATWAYPAAAGCHRYGASSPAANAAAGRCLSLQNDSSGCDSSGCDSSGRMLNSPCNGRKRAARATNSASTAVTTIEHRRVKGSLPGSLSSVPARVLVVLYDSLLHGAFVLAGRLRTNKIEARVRDGRQGWGEGRAWVGSRQSSGIRAFPAHSVAATGRLARGASPPSHIRTLQVEHPVIAVP